MGVHHRDGYSATVEGYFIFGNQRYRLAKTNGAAFTLADPCQIPEGAEGEFLIVVDGQATRRRVLVTAGAKIGQDSIPYKVVVGC